MSDNENEDRTEVFKNIMSQLDSSFQLGFEKIIEGLLIIQQNLNQKKGDNQ